MPDGAAFCLFQVMLELSGLKKMFYTYGGTKTRDMSDSLPAVESIQSRFPSSLEFTRTWTETRDLSQV